MISLSSAATMVAEPADGIVVTDPAIRYRPLRIRGRRYRVTVTAPTTRNGSGPGDHR
ncbi:hypothetical protein DFR76_109438 [Nocardia pseudobrasiliensis]|uniref:Uncharacterized protein n=1 Tax=Nocardia pseudobrasiliensis TaxID=45979 RepID=A0A370I011_9NOCA|nr:hypothetical protein DFR76_109438 [Nocardia pseudobrasiliensis]